MPQNQAQSETVELKQYAPHPSRTNSILYWHVDQIRDQDPAVAILHIAVTANGQIKTVGMGLDPVHAEIILREIDEARARIAEYLMPCEPSNVIPLRRPG
jgi:hypothetical protein